MQHLWIWETAYGSLVQEALSEFIKLSNVETSLLRAVKALKIIMDDMVREIKGKELRWKGTEAEMKLNLKIGSRKVGS